MIRAMYGVTAITSVSTGSTSSFGCSHAWSCGGISDTAGKTWNTVVPSSRRRTMKPGMPCKIISASPPSVAGGGCAASGSHPAPDLTEPDRPVAVPEGVERQHALVALLQALHLRRVAVEQRAEAPDD